MNAERGRPRSFDMDTALEQATQVFWRLGFQGASMAELTAATGLSKPSLYAAFGDKESLYLQCLNRYVARQVELQVDLLEQEADARAAVEHFMRTMAAMQADPKLPGGCFVVTGTADCGSPGTPAAVEAALRNALGGGVARMQKRLERADPQTELPPGMDAHQLATLFGAVLTGMAVMSKGGADRTRLEGVVDAAMAVWPPAPKRPRRRAATAG
ncbi:TetR/AcrR family transcriptional regulator [Ideonella sp. BN130291]|uniref:TetR/AcrR family transcriptional regulator n=1 Tax=Ideonella sp. BN130291 TaxID=3112940 RepID=UPI002E2669EE|nr:TetR/AcrR family transcriptional regulator [Ideonella sp. BN130291]